MNSQKKAFQTLVALTLLAGLLGPALGPGPAGASRLHPALAQLAAESPALTIAVIVQKADPSDRAERLAVQLGATITFDLHIINAFAAEMTAAAARQLALSPAIRWVSLDAPMRSTDCNSDCLNSSSSLKNVYEKVIRADKAWLSWPKRQGTGVGVAVVDSGVSWQTDLYTVSGANRVVANVRFNTDVNQTYFDNYGHGSHIAGIVGGNGRNSNGQYIGVAPMANIINVKVSNDDGGATASTVVAGLQWVLEHRAEYNIRVVNVSLNSAVAESYHHNPLNAAVEILWFNGIVVVVAAGNTGSSDLYAPANDPFVITVGATNDRGTTTLSDDAVAAFSGYGTTEDGFAKPDLVAPGQDIVSLMGNRNGVIPTQHPGNWINTDYFSMSGTSMSAPQVAGAVALLLEDEPNLTPDQVKYRLMATANKNWPGYSANQAGAGYLDAFAAVRGTTTQAANMGVAASQLLWTGTQPVTWGSVNWNSVNWNSVNWNSVNWNSVNWNSVNWNSDYWGP